MMDTRLNTLDIIQLQLLATFGDTPSAETKRTKPTFISEASKLPLRIVVQNVSFAAEVYLSLDASTLQTNEPGGNTFLLQAGVSLTLMLAPQQKIYGISLSTGAKVSIAVSEALPLDKA
jgi:hypothetical protein